MTLFQPTVSHKIDKNGGQPGYVWDVTWDEPHNNHHLQLQQHSLSITHESDQSSSSHPVPSYPDVNLLIMVVIMDFYCFCRYVVLLCVLAL